MNIILVLLVLLAAYFIYSAVFKYNEAVYVKSNVDNRTYMIRSGKGQSIEHLRHSADTLAQINNRVENLIVHLSSKYSSDANNNFWVTKLKNNYDHNALSEAARDNRFTTYTIDKEKMHVCLRTRDKQENLYDLNTLMYVVIHELAHMCNYDKSGNPIHGHGEQFKYIFRKLILEAQHIGVYKYIDYERSPQEYCGIMISSQIAR